MILDLVSHFNQLMDCGSTAYPLSAILPPPSTRMGDTCSAALPDDAACEDAVRTFIAEDLERVERPLRRAEKQLGVVW